jgi:hypothetical protein
MFASSSKAAMLASVQVPVVVADPAIAEVSTETVLDAAVVSTAPLSFFAHAVMANPANASLTTPNLDVIICPFPPDGPKKTPLS